MVTFPASNQSVPKSPEAFPPGKTLDTSPSPGGQPLRAGRLRLPSRSAPPAGTPRPPRGFGARRLRLCRLL